jgi:hypothetical protein
MPASRRLLYIERKSGQAEGPAARIGWATRSRSGRSVFYAGLELLKVKGRWHGGNHVDVATGDAFWVSGVKRRGSNVHPAERGVVVAVDDDARDALAALRGEDGDRR